MEWDPLAEEAAPVAAAAEGAPVPGAPWSIENVVCKLTERDHSRLLKDVHRKADKEMPWKTAPDASPDLSWHKPTCTFEKWTHTDVKVQLGQGIAYITLNRPADNNALTAGVIAALCDALFLLHSRPDIRVAVFTGEGKMLCSGRDPKGDNFGFAINATAAKKEVEEEGKLALACGAFPDDKINLGRLYQTNFWHVFATLPQFSICLANGSAFGDGMGIVCCCDMVISLKASFFGFDETKFGIVNAIVSPYLLNKTFVGIAKKMLLQGHFLSAEAAMAKKIVNKVADTLPEAKEMVVAICAEITKCGPKSVSFAKELAMGLAGNQVSEHIIFYSLVMLGQTQASEEAAQGAKFANKPKPWEAQPIKV